MISNQFIQYYGEAAFIEVLIAKFVFHEAKDLSDSEIERCLKGCVLGDKLVVACKELRNKIDWKKVIRGQKKYLSECDNHTAVALPNSQGQLILF